MEPMNPPPETDEEAAEVMAADLLSRDYDRVYLVEWKTTRGTQVIVWPMRLTRERRDH